MSPVSKDVLKRLMTLTYNSVRDEACAAENILCMCATKEATEGDIKVRYDGIKYTVIVPRDVTLPRGATLVAHTAHNCAYMVYCELRRLPASC